MNEERENKEWLNEYPVLKQVNPAHAFTVPLNYFEETEGRIMDKIRLAEFKQAHPQGGFTLPANYFNQLTQNITSRIAVDDIVNKSQGFSVPTNYFDELTQNINSIIAIDSALNTGKGFTVPQNYFENLAGNIQSRVVIDELLNTEKGFTVPENYFEELPQNIESRIAVEELINEEEGFTLPANYFESLEARILQNTIGTAQPVIPNKVIVRKLWATAAFKYATAACIALFIGGAVLMTEFNDKAIHNRSDLHKALSKVSKTDMESYLELNGDASTLMENADPNSLNASLSDDANQDKLN